MSFGYSMGSDVALQLVIRHPDVVRKLVLASASYTLSGVHPGLLDGLAEMKPEVMFGSPWHEEYMRIAPRPEDFNRFFAKKTRDGPPVSGYTGRDDPRHQSAHAADHRRLGPHPPRARGGDVSIARRGCLW